MSIVQSEQLTLVTGATGSPHVSSAEAGEQNVAIFGTGVVALDGSHPVYISGGAIKINTAELMFDGRHITIPSSITYPMDTDGTYSYAVYLRYNHDDSGQESAGIEIAKSNSTGQFSSDDHAYTSTSYSPRYGSTTARRKLAEITSGNPRSFYAYTTLLPTSLAAGSCMVVHQGTPYGEDTDQLLKKLPYGATVYTPGGSPYQYRGGHAVDLNYGEQLPASLDGRWRGGVQIRTAVSGRIMHADIRAVCQVTIVPPYFQETNTLGKLPEWACPSTYIIADAPLTSTSRTLTRGAGYGVQITPNGDIESICLDESVELHAGDVLHASISWVTKG